MIWRYTIIRRWLHKVFHFTSVHEDFQAPTSVDSCGPWESHHFNTRALSSRGPARCRQVGRRGQHGGVAQDRGRAPGHALHRLRGRHHLLLSRRGPIWFGRGWYGMIWVRSITKTCLTIVVAGKTHKNVIIMTHWQIEMGCVNVMSQQGLWLNFRTVFWILST